MAVPFRAEPGNPLIQPGSGSFSEDEWAWSAYQSNTQIQTGETGPAGQLWVTGGKTLSEYISSK